jgi:succinate dehydrogenase / fumarate reductase flavoprotein subunit
MIIWMTRRMFKGITKGLSEGIKGYELRDMTWKRRRPARANTNFNVMETDSCSESPRGLNGATFDRNLGSPARTDYPKRDDLNFLKHTLAYYSESQPHMAWHPITFTRYAPVERKY